MENNSGPDLPSYDRSISGWFFLVCFVLAASLGLAVVFYPDPFSFWVHPLSNMGTTVSRTGQPNTVPRLIFSVGMIIESFIMLQIGAHYAGERSFRNQSVKRSLALLGAVGFLVSIFPNDLFHDIHSLGVGTVVGVMYFVSLIFLYELKDHLPTWLLYVYVSLLQVSVFPYAVAFFANWPTKQSYQKICIIGVFYVLLKSVSISEESFQPREIFSRLSRFQH
jgi:hypothetical protein